MIRMVEVTKKFAEVTAVNNLSLEIQKGEIFGLLGPNGAGKTTLINILCGLMSMTKGSITFGGLDIKKDLLSIKRILGVVPQEIGIYEDLSAFDNIKFFASLYGIKGKGLKEAVEKALEFTGLKDSAKKFPKSFSGGMKRRLNIACGIAHDPEVVIMDEPTVGIDPQSRNHILESVKELKKLDRTIIYTTHYMEEAEQLCSNIAIIDHGKIIAQGTNEELQSLIKDKSRYIISLSRESSINTDELLKIQGVLNVELSGNTIYIDNDKGINNLPPIISYLAEKDIPLSNLELDAPSLEMVFLNLTGRKLRD